MLSAGRKGHATVGIEASLDAVRSAATILEAIRRADDLTLHAGREDSARTVRLLARAVRDGVASGSSDQLGAIASVHALGQVVDPRADDVLLGLLGDGVAPFLREHAAWALGSRLPRPEGIAPLVALIAAGGFAGMLAQRTVERWGAVSSEYVLLALEGALLGMPEPEARERLVETAGLVPGRISRRLLVRVAADTAEGPGARAAAVAGLGDLCALAATGGVQPSEQVAGLLNRLAARSDELADVARLALFDLTPPRRFRAPWSAGLTVAQLFLHADIDRTLSQVGTGDNGGIATLLVRLGDALVAGRYAPQDGAAPESRDLIERVVTISRGRPRDALGALFDVGSTLPGHRLTTVPFTGAHAGLAESWPRRIATQRGLRRILRAGGPIDAIHLRMADVGSLAAAAVARELDIPLVFTVAPDPHATIRALDESGELTHANFGAVDAEQHFWFRTRLVQRLVGDAAHLVLFPRPDLHRDLRALVGLDIEGEADRCTVVSEGIDLDVIGRAPQDGAALGELDDLLRTLPEDRRGLPLAITVGRLHPVKGMAALAAAWAGDPGLRARCNLLVVGGDLDQPSQQEQAELDRIGTAVPLAHAPDAGLLLAGHRENAVVAGWLAGARFGRPGLAAPGGAYVCASVKEEFGLALLEALATGLVVVAPASGGPATYVEHAVTGYLVDTRDAGALAAGVARALDLAAGPRAQAGAERAAAMVRRRFTIAAMADGLGTVYRDVAAQALAARGSGLALSAS